jgi:hypothetical protein
LRALIAACIFGEIETARPEYLPPAQTRISACHSSLERLTLLKSSGKSGDGLREFRLGLLS